ncbi:hypothetical protein G6F35_011575 [Rhizopus arrhizus]|nr:hypothetical protein G6F35_011575 [Rhizopus arrhizus]
MAYVAQETPALDRPAIEYAIDGDVTLRKLEAELAALEAEPESAENGLRMGDIYAALADADAYTVHSRAEQLLTGLGVTQAQMHLPLTSFSGGWRMRLNLAQALMCPSDLLLLDEPTNHLDLDAIIWLEDWLKRYPGTLIVISHDRDFLDGVVNVIVHIDERKLKRYSGNYSSFERQHAPTLAPAVLHRPLQGPGQQGRGQGGVGMTAATMAAPAALATRELVRRFGGLAATDGVSLDVAPGELHALIGPNGAGKTTLINLLSGELRPDGGAVTLGAADVSRATVQERLHGAGKRLPGGVAQAPARAVGLDCAARLRRRGGGGPRGPQRLPA